MIQGSTLKLVANVALAILFTGCAVFKPIDKNKPYDYGWYPKTYQDALTSYHNYDVHFGCAPGETIASVGAGNGRRETGISCVVSDITWYLEEIDSARLQEFPNVLAYYGKLHGAPVKATFHLVFGNEKKTNLPKARFDRIIMANVFHEIGFRPPIMEDIHQSLKPGGVLVIMERMADKPGEWHKDCNFPMLYGPDFLKEMAGYNFILANKVVAEPMSNLVFYTFEL